MDSTLKNIVKSKIDSLKGNAFQEFVNELFLIFYESNFITVKQKHDMGSDGIINSDTIIACYAPERYDLRDFQKKINNSKKGQEGDFQKYQTNWELTHTKWTVIYNGEWLANMIKYIKDLKSDADTIGQAHLLNMIGKLSWTKKRSIYNYLGIEDDYIKIGLLDEVIEDLMNLLDDNKSQKEISGKEKMKGFTTDLRKKIDLNYINEQDIELAIIEFEAYLQVAILIENMLGSNPHFPALIAKIQTEYKQLNSDLSFKERKNILKKNYAGKKKDDELYCHYVDMFLLYTFEQCLIGKKDDKK